MVSSTTSPASDVTIARVHLRSVRLLFLHLFPFLFSCFYLIFASFATSCVAAASSSSSFLQFVRVVGLSGRVFASLNLCCILWLLTLLSTVVDSGFEVFDSLSLSLSLSLSCCCCSSLQQPGLRWAFHCWEKGQNQHTTEQGPDGLLLPESQTL
jgi:hypothetical protein